MASAAVFALALVVAVIGLRAERGRRPAPTPIVARHVRDALHRGAELLGR